MTQSMRVAPIDCSICTWLLLRGAPLEPAFFIESDLVEGLCLANDLWHPPFGHQGERTVLELMLGRGGFEGDDLITEPMFEN